VRYILVPRDETANVQQNGTGKIIKEFKFQPKHFPHPILDVVLLHLENEEKFLAYLKDIGRELNVMKLSTDGSAIGQVNVAK
jgi:hypothetical protein